MIIYYFLQFLSGIGTAFGYFLPKVTMLPWGIDSVLVSAIGGYRTLANYFTPLNTIMTAFLIYLGFRIVLRILKAIPLFGNTISHD